MFDRKAAARDVDDVFVHSRPEFLDSIRREDEGHELGTNAAVKMQGIAAKRHAVLVFMIDDYVSLSRMLMCVDLLYFEMAQVKRRICSSNLEVVNSTAPFCDVVIREEGLQQLYMDIRVKAFIRWKGNRIGSKNNSLQDHEPCRRNDCRHGQCGWPLFLSETWPSTCLGDFDCRAGDGVQYPQVDGEATVPPQRSEICHKCKEERPNAVVLYLRDHGTRKLSTISPVWGPSH